MKIVIEVFEAGGVGAVRHNALQQAVHLAAQGESVAIVSNTFPAPLAGVRYIHAPSYHRSFRMGTLLPEVAFSLNAARRIDALQQSDGVDCCVGHGHSCSLGLARLRRRHGVPFVIVAHADVFGHPLSMGPALALFYMAASVYAYRAADHVVAVGSGIARRAARLGGASARVSVVPNGIDPEELGSDQRGDMADLSRTAEHEILHVGSLVKHKGVQTLIKALGRLKDLDLRCTFAGSGPEENRLRALARDMGVAHKCRFKGFLPRMSLGDFYRWADVFVCPSLDDAQGVVNLEALSQGCPVVASRVGGIPDMVKHGVNGLLVPPNDPERLALAIRRVCTDRDLRLRLAGAAKASVAPFRWDRLIVDFRQVLATVVRECRRRRKSR